MADVQKLRFAGSAARSAVASFRDVLDMAGSQGAFEGETAMALGLIALAQAIEAIAQALEPERHKMTPAEEIMS